jgi:hypothetical protein
MKLFLNNGDNNYNNCCRCLLLLCLGCFLLCERRRPAACCLLPGCLLLWLRVPIFAENFHQWSRFLQRWLRLIEASKQPTTTASHQQPRSKQNAQSNKLPTTAAASYYLLQFINIINDATAKLGGK